jgi:magnesium chelatase subunit D
MWADAAAAADLLAVDPVGLGGARLRGRPGPGRDLWLERFRDGLADGAPFRRIPAHATEERLLGGLDLAATLSAGRPIARTGLLAEADRGAVVLAMAERASASVAAHLSSALDAGRIAVERDGIGAKLDARIAVVALDEGAEADETAPAALVERLAFDLALDRLRPPPDATEPGAVEAARERLPDVTVSADIVRALCEATLAYGVASPRAAIFAIRAARAAAALDGRDEASREDAALAARLVLGPRATQAPAPPEDEPDEPPPDEPEPPEETPPEPERDDGPTLDELTEIVLAAARATLPAGLLTKLRAAEAASRARGPSDGTAGAMRRSANRGRPLGARPGKPEGGARLDVVETLRSAAPWQPLRRRETGVPEIAMGGRVLIRRDDFRIKRFKRPAETATIFCVDASGSSAAQRLAEAKGAVELLLAESYVRRDRVALVAFRGTGGELILPPTRSLVRAKRGLAGLPGGGGTPLAAGIDIAAEEAEAAKRRGWTPTIVLLTDGRANVTREGVGGRAAAEAEALAAARRVRLSGVAALMIDTLPRANPKAAEIALEMGARYLALPRADAAVLSEAIKATRD